MAGLTGCAVGRHSQNVDQRVEGTGAEERRDDQRTNQGIEDSRTAERVREALAAGADYKYDGVKVTVRDGVVQLSGFVNTSAQKNSAAAAASNVAGVKSVESRLAVKE